MVILGVDASYRSSGFCVLDTSSKTPCIVDTFLYKPVGDDLPRNLHQFSRFLYSVLRTYPVDAISLERLSMSRNLHTVRMISYMEAIVISLAGSYCPDNFHHFSPPEARKIVFGTSKIKKREIYDSICSSFPIHGFEDFNDGGSDETDSTVIALSAFKTINGLINAK